MEFVLTLIRGARPYLLWPGLAGLTGWILALGLLFFLLYRYRALQSEWSGRHWGIFAALLAGAFATALFIGFRFPLEEALPVPGQLGRIDESIWMIAAALPWVFAAGLLGPMASFILALLSGLILAVFYSHNPFTALEHALFGLLIGVMVCQRYRTPVYTALRRPLVASIVLSLLHPFVFVIGILLWAVETPAVELDFAYRMLAPSFLPFAASLTLAGLLAEVFVVVSPESWGFEAPLEPSPAERSIETRSVYLMGWMIAFTVGLLSLAGWFVAHRSASTLIEERMEGSARLAAENVPNVLEVGQNLIQSAADDQVLNGFDLEVMSQALSEKLTGAPYFNALLLVDSERGVIAGAGRYVDRSEFLTTQEEAGVMLAVQGVPFQYYASTLSEGESETVISFITPVPGAQRVLVARSDLAENPFTSPLLTSLGNLADIQGQGILVDETGLILYHPIPEMISTVYGRDPAALAGFSSGLSADGERMMIYALPARGRSWIVLIQVPAQEVGQLALQIAAPPVGLLLTLAVLSLLLLRVTLRIVTGSLRNLSDNATRIAEDPSFLSIPFEQGGVDEVGIMRQAFEGMRVSLNARMVEQEQLLFASHGVASSLDFGEAIRPLLGAAMTGGAVSARVVLTAGALPEYGAGTARSYGAGTTPRYAYLDSQMLHLCRKKNPLVIDNPAADEDLKILDGRPAPVAILGIALRQQDHYFGVLWVAYSEPHAFSQDELRFMATLGGQGALAASNARLFRSAEVGRERLAAILASTPDPVIVTDQNNDLLLANPAAWQVLEPALETGQGQPIESLLADADLNAMLKTGHVETETHEISTADGRVFVAKATDVLSDQQPVGRICVLRDVTRFKELDALKSEFVSTVSHDLGSPLQVMGGYATMVTLVGDLSDEQAGYINKIIVAVGRMSNIVNNLLQLGRIEAGIDLELAMLDPFAVLKKVAGELQSLAGKKDIRLVVNHPLPDLPSLEADEVFLERALHNLIDNAIKYTPPGGQVHASVRYEAAEDALHFAVLDNGIGISPPDQDRLFEKFFRVASRVSRKQRGTGLGLAIVKSIAESHHGRAWVKSELGRGSVFFMSLPTRQ